LTPSVRLCKLLPNNFWCSSELGGAKKTELVEPYWLVACHALVEGNRTRRSTAGEKISQAGRIEVGVETPSPYRL
jgi:hypothetical protein